MNTLKKSLLIATGIVFSLFNYGYAGDEIKASPVHKQSALTQQVQKDVDRKMAKKANGKYSEVTKEALAAIAETGKALNALSAKKPDTKAALAALEKSTGKLELLLVREPDLALAPIDVAVETHDLLVSPEMIKSLISDARDFLKDGDIQNARQILNTLVSEIDFNITSIPLATYPVATKAAAVLIEDGKIEQAKKALRAQLDTLVVSKEIIPLPVMRAALLLEKVEALVENGKRTGDDNKKLTNLLNEAKTQLKMGELLGYGKHSDYKKIHKQIKKLEKKIAKDKSGKGWFDSIKKQLSDLF